MERLSFFLLCVSILNFLKITKAGDSVTPALNLIDGQTVVSDGGRFELGFFSPGQSRNRYLGIWYKKVSNDRGIIWVANRESPLNNNNGVLKMSTEGKLVLLNETGNNVVWFINSSKKTDNSVVIVAQLLNTGNLVVKEENDNNPNNYLWQSFDHPGAVLLPGMKLGFNFKTGTNWYLSSWKTTEDASSGDFKLGIDPHGVPQIVLWQRENVALRIGHWNGIRFPGFPYMNPNSMFGYAFISNEDEVYFSLEFDKKSSVGNMMLLNQSGVFAFLGWNDHIHNWFAYSVAPLDLCASYNSCGSYGSCNVDNWDTACQCLNGFVPSVPEDWNSMNWTSGCVRRTPLDCMHGEGFRKFTGIKLPDTRNSVVIQTMRLAECEEVCLKNCSCTAYAMADIKERNGCLLWFGDLIDMRTFPGNGDDIYVKMAASELDVTKGGFKEKRRVIFLVTCLLPLLGVLLLAVMTHLWKRKRQKNRENTEVESMEELELPMLDFNVMTAATEYFSLHNKLGEGGFGPVYKGKLRDGQEIAVKRLSKNSTQGLEEFKNEVKLVSKLQHRNLVKLLGCCIHGEEKMLIYEYMPNKSLDSFIFDKTKSFMLDWATRYKIIHGIARGLVYLHQDSRLRIVHRDLKSSNILLDMEMNPKISDFGLARPFGEDQSEANTNKVVGTYGYMSPEYAIDGRFSFKSDVFSFGVIVLEIVSGKKNRGFYHPDHYHNLLGHAWKLWQESEAVLLLDARIRNTFNLLEVLRCIHVGLLCVQQCPDDRPSMSQVILMLGNEVSNLPQPELPGFFIERILQEANSTSKGQESVSTNELSITMLRGR